MQRLYVGCGAPDQEGRRRCSLQTFSYININITDADLKKCMTVLNKSKWKGGTLQIETAKESFLHRLAEERQTAEQQRLLPPAAEDQKQKMLDSLSKAGVENFTMKAAVPGTEVPGHEDWVVSKFGRVLPVLQLKCQKGSRARTLKYDPSKYSHNIRKLDRPSADQSASDLPTPVSQLTWELQGGDDDISKKRRGEFPAYEPPKRKKSRTDAVNSLKAEGKPRLKQSVDPVALTEAPQVTNGHKPPSAVRPAQRKGPPLTLSDIDSDDEIHRIVAVQSSSHNALQQEEDEDKLEVVGLDYLVTPGRARQQQKGGDEEENDYDSADTDELLASRKPPPPRSSSPPPPQERPTLTAGNVSGNNTDRKRKTKKKSKAGEEEDDSTDAEEPSTQKRRDAGKLSSQKQSKKKKVLPVVKPSSSESESDDDDEEEEEEECESADSSSDSDYEAMFSNVTRLEISLADLQKLAEEFQDTSETTAPSSLSVSEQETKPPKKGTTPEEILAALMEDDSSEEEEEQQQPKKKKKKKRKADATTQLLPAFKGTKALNEGSETEEGQKEEEEGEGTEVKKLKVDHKATSSKMNGQKHTETESSEDEEENEEEEEEEPKKKEAVVKNMAEKAESVSSSSSDEEEEEEEEQENKGKVFKTMAKKAQKESSSSSDEDEEEEEEVLKANQTVLTSKAAAASSSSSSSEEDEDEILPAKDAVKAAPPPAPHSESSSSEEEEEEEEKQAPLRVPLGAKEEEARQRKANIRRLAAVQQRQKETEENKKLIQGALANLDAPAAGAGKHIVFGSDDDDDEEADSDDEQQTTSEIKTPKKTLFQDSQSETEAPGHKNTSTKEKKLSGTHLFGSSEEEEEADEEEDGSRFDIRPEFEGRAGHKLMALQSRFGKDERFKMDSRFLEQNEDKEEESEKKKSGTEEEEALEEERKKSLSILQSVLGISQHTSSSSKATSKAKTFRDVSALHYDPSREEHAAFETKTEETKKESKAARRKKREEAQKLPEVSKEIYYDVSGDLKAVFGQTKEEGEEEEQAVAVAVAEKEETNWDQEEEKKKEQEEAGEQVEQPTPESSLLSAEKEEATGFKFSFFGDDAETGSGETAEYKIESIQAPKLSWQQDPRFHDSSSDEEEEEKGQEEEEKTQSNVIAKIEETPTKTGLFFFYPEDSRLTEGPKLFCRPSQLEEQKEQWEERRTELRQEYRKKHKDARRKLKTSVKS
ncbi:hypothetical protein KUCAC02_030095 [Chaenocephalus aceratus]|uniref:Uncharacterized protein n=1 Tax=Chaenocephalus aceratus TaxID=36190 RepID=A0ACB9XIH3_CHAAC|nr:hypothetical protein KUCAC02_030095 [Chaenocephalus aceratus]